MLIYILLLAFVVSSAGAIVLRAQRDQTTRRLAETIERAEAAEGGRANWQARAEQSEADVRRLNQKLREERARADTAERTVDELKGEQQDLVEQRESLTRELLDDHTGPVVICDRRNTTNDQPTVLVRFGGGPSTPKDQQSALRHAIRNGGGAMNADVQWRVAHMAWEVALSNLDIVIKRLPFEYGATRFFHTASTAEKCSSSCQNGLEWTDCSCACGGEHHGSGTDQPRDGWQRRGWRLLRDDWKEHQFDLDPYWYYDKTGAPRPEILAYLARRSGKQDGAA